MVVEVKMVGQLYTILSKRFLDYRWIFSFLLSKELLSEKRFQDVLEKDVNKSLR